MKSCPQCQTQNEVVSAICTNCGYRLFTRYSEPTPAGNQQAQTSTLRKRLPAYILIAVIGSGLSFFISRNILKNAEDRLKTEIAVTAEWNKQHAALKELEKRREEEAREREFNRFLYGRDTPPPEVTQQKIEQHLKKLAEEKGEPR